MRRKIMENKITVLKILAAVLILIFLLTCIPRSIDINYPAIRYSPEDPNMIIQTSIIMKGKLFKPLFFNAKYAGTCIIEGYDLTKKYKLGDIRFQKYDDGNGYITYTGFLPNRRPDAKIIGKVWISGYMNKICIWGGSPEDVEIHQGYFEPVIISAPAETKEEAMKIADQLISDKRLID